MNPRQIIQGFLDGLTDAEPGGPVVTADLLQAAREYLASPDTPLSLPEPELGEGGAPNDVTREIKWLCSRTECACGLRELVGVDRAGNIIGLRCPDGCR